MGSSLMQSLPRWLMLSMLSDFGLATLRDIVHNIDLVSQFVAGLGFEAFRDDTRTLYAASDGRGWKRLPP
jgi:hypothetical protein